jgi:hypothetical protein
MGPFCHGTQSLMAPANAGPPLSMGPAFPIRHLPPLAIGRPGRQAYPPTLPGMGQADRKAWLCPQHRAPARGGPEPGLCMSAARPATLELLLKRNSNLKRALRAGTSRPLKGFGQRPVPSRTRKGRSLRWPLSCALSHCSKRSRVAKARTTLLRASKKGAARDCERPKSREETPKVGGSSATKVALPHCNNLPLQRTKCKSGSPPCHTMLPIIVVTGCSLRPSRDIDATCG